MKRTRYEDIKVIHLDKDGNPLTEEKKKELAFRICKVCLELKYPGIIVTKKQAGDKEKAGKGNDDDSPEGHSPGHES